MSQRLIVLLYIVLLTGGGIWAGALLLEARAEYSQLKQVQALLESKLATAEARLREQERNLERLRSDSHYLERVIRERANGKPDEIIFRFDSAR